MRYSICEGCIYYQPRLLTETKNIPKSCNNPHLQTIFGAESGGFISGTQIIHCIHYCQHPINYSDVVINVDGIPTLGYILTKPREFKLVRVPKLYDNSKNLKTIDYEQKEPKADFTEDCPF